MFRTIPFWIDIEHIFSFLWKLLFMKPKYRHSVHPLGHKWRYFNVPGIWLQQAIHLITSPPFYLSTRLPSYWSFVPFTQSLHYNHFSILSMALEQLYLLNVKCSALNYLLKCNWLSFVTWGDNEDKFNGNFIHKHYMVIFIHKLIWHMS